jgi:hypothetical protein
MNFRDIAFTLAVSMIFPATTFAETDEERQIANCDWPDAAAAVETSKQVQAPTTNHPARGDSRSIEEIIASCDYPEEA